VRGEERAAVPTLAIPCEPCLSFAEGHIQRGAPALETSKLFLQTSERTVTTSPAMVRIIANWLAIILSVRLDSES